MLNRASLTRIRRHLGIELAPVGHIERLASALTGMLAIFALTAFECGLPGDPGAALLVASMGASSVLLFAVPHGALSQPWSVLVGHLVSAIAGVTAARYVPSLALASALAVGVAIGAMHYLRAIHPPGGATALAAVIGGPQVKALGYDYVLTPVMLNAAILVALAVALNWAFAWRRYPASLAVRSPAPQKREDAALTHADFVAALRRLGTFVDITEEEFLRLGQLMAEAARDRQIRPEDIRLGAYYSNAATGTEWSVRRIVDAAPGDAGTVIWRAVAGRDRHATGHATRQSFAEWAACEVVRADNAWTRPLHVPAE